MTRSIDDLKRWKSYGFVMTPVAKDKSPGLKPQQKWRYDWSDEVLLEAMMGLGMRKTKALLIYYILRLFGGSNYEQR